MPRRMTVNQFQLMLMGMLVVIAVIAGAIAYEQHIGHLPEPVHGWIAKLAGE